MVAAVLIMLISSRKANPVPEIASLNIIAALIILLREIIVSGLREYLAGLQVSVPVSALAKWKTTAQLFALGALILGGALPQISWVHDFGIACLWIAAALTLVSGYDYLRTGLKHMDKSISRLSVTKIGRFTRATDSRNNALTAQGPVPRFGCP